MQSDPTFSFLSRLCVLLLSLALFQSCSTDYSVIELGATQSMSITGKGYGQDAVLNPYTNTNSLAIVRNMGPHPFMIRIQQQDEIIEEISIDAKESQEILLKKGRVIFFDSDRPSKAKVRFRKYRD